MAMQTQREGPFRSFPGIPVSRGQTHCSGLRFLGQTCVSRFRGPAQPPWPRAQRQEQVLPWRRGPQGGSGGGGQAEGEGGYEVPKWNRVGTTWTPQRTPQTTNTAPPPSSCKHQLSREASQKPGVVFKEMQFDLPSSFRNPAHRTLPGPAGLVAAADAAAGTFNPLYADMC